MIDFSSIYIKVAPYLWLLIAVSLLSMIGKSAWFKGYCGELWVRLSARLFLDPSVYRAFHNVTLPTDDGSTQIDHLFVSQYGVFVVETKNMSGWIFGDEKQAIWTQKLYRRSYKFQNPLRQNYKHIKALESALGIPDSVCHSVIVFVGNSRFKTLMPVNVTTASQYVQFIKSHTRELLSASEVAELTAAIGAGRLQESRATARAHIRHVRSIREAKESEKKCHRCGSSMVLRKSRGESNAGSQFWGCSRYPSCRATAQLD